MKIITNTMAALGIAIILTSIVYGLYSMKSHDSQVVQARYESIREEGRVAARVGIPATANPHIRYPSDATLWLEGYAEVYQQKAEKP